MRMTTWRPARLRFASRRAAGALVLTVALAGAFAPPAHARRSSASASAPASAAASAEYRRQLGRTSTVDKLAASLGFGSLVGLGLPAIILIGGGMRAFDVEPPAPVSQYIDPHSPLYSWPFVLLALIAVALFFLSGNEKLSKGPKLLAQIAGVPPAVFLAFAVPIAAELAAPGTTTALLVDAGGALPTGASGAPASLGAGGVLLAIGLGVVALLCAGLLLVTRLFVSFLVWLSPFPFVDALVNLLFHGYAVGLIVLTFAAPPVALFVMGAQAVIALFLLRRLWRFSGAAFLLGTGALRWHLRRKSVKPFVELPRWGRAALDEAPADPELRLRGFVVEAPFAGRDTGCVLGLGERSAVLFGRSWLRVAEHRIPAPELHEVTVTEGNLYDEIELVHRQGAGPARALVSFRLGLPKDQRRALARLCAELRERGYDVITPAPRGKSPWIEISPSTASA